MISFELFGYPVNIMVGLDDYDENFKQTNQNWNVGCTAFAAFSVLWVIQLIAFTFYHSVGAVNGKGSIFGPWRNRVLFGRHTMDTVAMLGFSYMGYEALVNFGGFAAVPELIQNGAIMGVGGERAYVFSAATQRLCVMQIAYEAKNFCDSVIHNDGVVFLIHHTVTGLLAALSCRPFLHLYCAYFLGWSEISTAILCVLVLFDKDRGIKGLDKLAPITMQIFGVLFATTFTIFRVILWPYVNYYYWLDMYHMYQNNEFHSLPVAYIYMFVNVGLTILQFAWFKEIIETAVKMFSPQPEAEEEKEKENKIQTDLRRSPRQSKKVR